MTDAPANPNSDTPRAATDAALALAVVLGAAPFLHAISWDWDKALPLCLLPAVWACHRLGRATLDARERTDAALLAVAVVAALISIFFAPQPARAAVSSGAWLWVVAGALIARRFAGDVRATRLVIGAIAVSAAAGMVGVWALIEKGEATKFPFYAHPRIFGLHMLAAVVPALAFLAVPSLNGAKRVAAFVVATLVFGGLLWSGGRAPLVGLAAGLAVWFWRATREERGRLVKWFPAVALAAALLTLAIGAPRSTMGWWQTFTRTAQATTMSELSSTRTEIWVKTWSDIREAPLVGRGGDRYVFLQPRQDGEQPHNAPLQWWLEYGIFGALAIGALVVRRIAHGFRSEPHEAILAESTAWRRAAAAGLTAAAVGGLFDGVFHHAMIFVPVAVLAGLTYGPGFSPSQAPFVGGWMPAWRGLLVAATLVLGVHNWLFFHLQTQLPDGPNDAAPRVLRAFPSMTAGLGRWIEAWWRTNPDAALEWAEWAQDRAISAAVFHAYAAQIRAARGEFEAADRELEAALAKAHPTGRPDLEELRARIRAQAAGRRP